MKDRRKQIDADTGRGIRRGRFSLCGALGIVHREERAEIDGGNEWPIRICIAASEKPLEAEGSKSD